MAGKIALVHLAPVAEAHFAEDMWARVHWMVEAAPALGLERVELVDAADVLAAAPGAEPVARALGEADAVWWLGRLTFRAEAERLVAAIEAHLRALGRDVSIHEPADFCEESFSLARAYPLLEAAGVPQARTRFVPLSAEEAALEEPALRALIARRIADLGLRFDGGPLFFRTYYGTLKMGPGPNGAFGLDGLADGAANLVSRLREQRQEIGGLAIRDLLSIRASRFKRGRVGIRHEYRFYVVAGTPRFWALDYHLPQLGRLGIPWPELETALRPAPADLEAMRAIAAACGRALRSRLLVVDAAILDDGSISLIETNAGHCSGPPHAAVWLGAYAPFLRGIAGVAPPATPLAPAARRSLAETARIDLGSEGKLFGFFDD